jgi:hypothetical protein
LHAGDEYSAGLIARDVKTLSHLSGLDHVVIEAAEHAAEHAEVVQAMLGDDEVTIHNVAATITHAYNRPAPPRTITVWFADGDEVRHAHTALRREGTRGAVTYFVG